MVIFSSLVSFLNSKVILKERKKNNFNKYLILLKVEIIF